MADGVKKTQAGDSGERLQGAFDSAPGSLKEGVGKIPWNGYGADEQGEIAKRASDKSGLSQKAKEAYDKSRRKK